MNEDFNKLCWKLVQENDKNILNDRERTKALLLDHSNGKFKNEINLLIQTIDLGYPKLIGEASDFDVIRKSLSRRLTEENYIIEKIASSIVSLLVSLISGVEPVSARKTPVLEEDKINRDQEIWICGRCDTSNDFVLDYCEKCDKEFNPPL